MKKYLMTGITALAMVAGFTSCSHDDSAYEFNREANYQQAFEKEFGEIAPNQTWGFVDQGQGVTRSHFANKNEYANYFTNIQPDPTENGDEIEVVTKWFSETKSPATYAVNWSDFFVWQVSSTDAGKAHMDQLWCGATQSDMEHVNNFNAGNCADGSHVGHAMVMQNSGTAQWAYQESLNNVAHTVYDHFVCIPGYVIAPNNPNVANNYYVGLDYEAAGTDPNQTVARDYYYNDWIVRINPGEYKGAQRVFVEDLITSDLNNIDPSDWDFNDAVFDAYIHYNQYYEPDNYAVITLRAAGGTLPLTVGGKEVHEAFGVSVNQMVNTGKGPEVAPVIFRVKPTSANAKDIPVIVTAKDGTNIRLTAEQGQPTQMVAAPTEEHVKWLKERNHIKYGYPSFMEYVSNPSIKWYVPAVEEYLYQKWY